MCYCATLAETGACYHSVATSAIGDHPPKGCQRRVSQGLHGCGHTGSSMILIPIFLAKKWETSATKTCNFAGLSKKSHQSWLKAVRVQLPRPGNASPIISLMFNVFFLIISIGFSTSNDPSLFSGSNMNLGVSWKLEGHVSVNGGFNTVLTRNTGDHLHGNSMDIPIFPWFSWSMFHILETEHVSNLPP